MSISETDLISRREAVRRVSALLGGVAFVGGPALLAACERTRPAAAGGAYQAVGTFSAADVALLDEIADTILPTTAKSPGAKAAAVGPFMALMVTDTYQPKDQAIFRDGLRALDTASRQAGAAFIDATPQARLTLLQSLDREQKAATDRRDSAQRARKEAANKRADANLPDARQENAGTGDVASGAAITDADAPTHYFRMMKELAMLGYFTSEVGCTKAMRYVESPGRFDPCAPYAPGDAAWAPHA